MQRHGFYREDADAMRRMRTCGWSNLQIAEHYACAESTVSQIINGNYPVKLEDSPDGQPSLPVPAMSPRRRRKVYLDDVEPMRQLREQGLGYDEIGARYGVSKSTAYALIRGNYNAALLPRPKEG